MTLDKKMKMTSEEVRKAVFAWAHEDTIRELIESD